MKLRPQQEEICRYAEAAPRGLMAISAVPGSGKTFTLAALAARLLARGLRDRASLDLGIFDERELLVVTFTTSAVDNIRSRIRTLLKELNLPEGGYRVLTLHGLAHLILRMRPELAGTGSDFDINDELSGNQPLRDATRGFIHVDAPEFWQSYLPDPADRQAYARARDRWEDATERIGGEVMRLAKNLRMSPEDVLGRLRAQLPPQMPQDMPSLLANTRSPFLAMGALIYKRYESILAASGRLDFDDLILGAIRALEADDAFRTALGRRWHVILEDEAQDSTPLQERILSLLCRDHKNWVRVGDPNQAIMTTFTASDARFFRDFANRADVTRRPLTRSGRSAQPIIDLANWLAHWSATAHPEAAVRALALSERDLIEPLNAASSAGLINPPANEARIHVEPYATEEVERARVTQSAADFVMKNPQRTCAILVPTNAIGEDALMNLEKLRDKLHDVLEGRELFQDQLKNSKTVRDVADALAQAARFCANPLSMGTLANLRKALLALNVGHRLANASIEQRLMAVLRSKLKVEQLLFPSAAAEPAIPQNIELDAQAESEIEALAQRVAKWVRASVLPIDQLLLTIAHDVLTKDSDLAIAHSLALSMRRFAAVNPSAQLGDLADKLADIAANRTSYLSRALIESGFEPQQGVITVTTMHKAKGLEWDRVYLLCVDQSEFPHDPEATGWRGELWFLGNRDAASEARKALEGLHENRSLPSEVQLTREARNEYIAERLRLLYVGITRARRELQISYSRQRGRNAQNALALAMQEWQAG